MKLSRKAFSMIELMVGICIFALAILPLVWMSSKQTTGAYHVGKHMMAGQLAASYMDNILSRDYDEIQKLVGKKIEGYVLDKENNVKNLMDLKEIAESLQNEKANNNIQASFKNFKYKIELKENKDEKAIRAMVKVSYLVKEESKRIDDPKKRASLIIYSIKYGNKNE
ncbi:MAG: hypothetical protein IKO19_13005 [Candidatus Riflebacteria bacterium]|nr:hypothetical protein [Candidatus Riflebacteria bacterium]